MTESEGFFCKYQKVLRAPESFNPAQNLSYQTLRTEKEPFHTGTCHTALQQSFFNLKKTTFSNIPSFGSLKYLYLDKKLENTLWQISLNRKTESLSFNRQILIMASVNIF